MIKILQRLFRSTEHKKGTNIHINRLLEMNSKLSLKRSK